MPLLLFACPRVACLLGFGGFLKEILDYLSLFHEAPASSSTEVSPVPHPAELVLQAFKDEESAKGTLSKLRAFLEEALKIHGQKMDCAPFPAACFKKPMTPSCGTVK